MTKDFLVSDHKIYDSVHHFIRFDDLERDLIDCYPFQRLHYIHQLGIVFLVYPGATHSRFEHSLGVMELSTRIFDTICKYTRPDIYHIVPRKGSAEYFYWKKVLRVASICHDFGHLPFSHVAEKEIFGKKGHEQMTLKLIRSHYVLPILEKMAKTKGYLISNLNRDFVDDVCKASLGEEKLNQIENTPFTPWERLVSQIVTGDFFGADRIDYLIRDSKSTGVVHGKFDFYQLIEMLRILPDPESEFKLGIDANGVEACEALLLSRYFMHRRVYQYPSVKSYNFHLKRFMNKVYRKEDFFHQDYFLSMTDAAIINEMIGIANNDNHPASEDAKKIILRKKRYEAIFVPATVNIEELKGSKEFKKIPQEKIEIEFCDPMLSEKDLTFSVAKYHFSIKDAKEVSQILSVIPTLVGHWLYVDPEYQLQVLEAVEKYSKKRS